MSNLQKFNLDNQIRFLLLRYLNDIKKVAEEASKLFKTKITEEYVHKVYLKFKKKQSRETDYWIACNLTQELFHALQHRMAMLESMFQQWDGKEIAQVSLCCAAPVKQESKPIYICAKCNKECEIDKENIVSKCCSYSFKRSEKNYFICLKCNKECNVKIVYLTDLEKLKKNIIIEMREESKHLLEIAKEMGFTNREPMPINKTTNYNVIVNSNKKSEELNDDTLRQLEALSPREREKIRLELMSQIESEAEFEEKKEENKDEKKDS